MTLNAYAIQWGWSRAARAEFQHVCLTLAHVPYGDDDVCRGRPSSQDKQTGLSINEPCDFEAVITVRS